MSISFWEILDRAINTGPVMDSDEFDMNLFKETKRLKNEYDIEYDPENPIPRDNSLINDIFEAGLELFIRTGSYCVDSQRVIKYSEEEVKEAIKEASNELILGSGNYERNITQRKSRDYKESLNLGGVIESNPEEDAYVKIYQALGRYSELDALYWGPCEHVEGFKWRPGTPLELHSGSVSVSWVREALRRAGKIGLPLISACPSALADMNSFQVKDGMTRNDAIAIPTTSELKTDYDSLSKVAFSIDKGCMRNPYWLPMIGGYAGGPEGAAIVGVAGGFHSLLTCFTKLSGFNNAASITMKPQGVQSTRSVIWSTSAFWQALNENTDMIGGLGVTTASGPGSKMMFLETAATSILIASSVGHVTHGVRKAVLEKPDQAGALEPRFQGEVARTASSLKLEEANEIINELLFMYEDDFESPPIGKSFKELHDLETLKPHREYYQTYFEAREILSELGLEIN